MLISLVRAVIVYAALVISVRLMGKRQLGEMEPSEFVIAMLLANLAVVPMQEPSIPLSAGLLPMLVVLGLELMITFLCLRSVRLRQIFCGVPIILIDNGVIVQRNLRRTRITLDELSGQLRSNGAISLDQVRYAILETNGQISTFLFDESGQSGTEKGTLPYTLISDGRVLRENLALSGHDAAWLHGELKKRGCRQSEVYLLTVDDAGRQVFVKKEREN